jgi:hypothetical protein
MDADGSIAAASATTGGATGAGAASLLASVRWPLPLPCTDRRVRQLEAGGLAEHGRLRRLARRFHRTQTHTHLITTPHCALIQQSILAHHSISR